MLCRLPVLRPARKTVFTPQPLPWLCRSAGCLGLCFNFGLRLSLGFGLILVSLPEYLKEVLVIQLARLIHEPFLPLRFQADPLGRLSLLLLDFFLSAMSSFIATLFLELPGVAP